MKKKKIPNSTNRALAECKGNYHQKPWFVKPLCPTRWTVRTGAINAILENYEHWSRHSMKCRDAHPTIKSTEQLVYSASWRSLEHTLGPNFLTYYLR